MFTSLFARHEAERPFLIIGIVGSLVAIASFLWLPTLSSGGLGGVPPRPPMSLWDLLRLSKPSGNVSMLTWVLLTLVPLCAGVTLVIGCVALFRSLPRLAVHVYTLALLAGLLVFCFTMYASFAIGAEWGFLGLGAGYLAMLVGRFAFKAG